MLDQETMRAELLNLVESQKAAFLQVAEAFYTEDDRTKARCLVLLRQINATIATVTGFADQDQGPFIQNLLVPLRQLQTQAQALLDQLETARQHVRPEYVCKEDEVKVYVSLYQADGHDKQKWEAQLASIETYLVGRPIYQYEADIRRVIRQKLVGTTEAYAVLVVPKHHIVANDISAKKTDRHGFALVTIEASEIRPEHVLEFVHGSKRYHLIDGHLIRKEATDLAQDA